MNISEELQEYIEYNVDLLENWDNKNNQFSFYNNISVECLEEANLLLNSIDLPINIKYTYFRVFDWLMWECIDPDINEDVYDLIFNNENEIVLQYESASVYTETKFQLRYVMSTDSWRVLLEVDESSKNDYYSDMSDADFDKSGQSWKSLVKHLSEVIAWDGFRENKKDLYAFDPSKSKKYVRK